MFLLPTDFYLHHPWPLLLRLFFDIRTERAIRYAAISVCALTVFLYWDRSQGGQIIPSTVYWGIIIPLGVSERADPS